MTVEEISYDRGDLGVGTVHVGVGSLHRSHQARYLDKLVGCIHAPSDLDRVLARMEHPDNRIVTLTITEDGYSIDDPTATSSPDEAITRDATGRGSSRTAFGSWSRHSVADDTLACRPSPSSRATRSRRMDALPRQIPPRIATSRPRARRSPRHHACAPDRFSSSRARPTSWPWCAGRRSMQRSTLRHQPAAVPHRLRLRGSTPGGGSDGPVRRGEGLGGGPPRPVWRSRRHQKYSLPVRCRSVRRGDDLRQVVGLRPHRRRTHRAARGSRDCRRDRGHGDTFMGAAVSSVSRPCADTAFRRQRR